MIRRLYSLLVIAVLLFAVACGPPTQPQQRSDSGVTKATTQVKTDANGQTAEQANIIAKVQRDTELGAVKHLYVISSYTGDVLEYSTVKGKVTSGGKRLSPKTVFQEREMYGNWNTVNIGNATFVTNEVIDEYGSYGDSSNYFYWFDAQGMYHQYFPSGGTYVHISDKPLKPRKAVVTFEPVQ